MKTKIEENWEERYKSGETGWDIGMVSPPLKAYINQLKDKTTEILIPGAGNAHEAEYLFNNGFRNVYVADVAETPLKNLINRIPQFPKDQIWNINFFDIEKKFDLIIEQTFFCALLPSLRNNYAEKMQDLLKPDAKLAGVLFDFPLSENGPPFGGNKEEYLSYFKDKFIIETFDRCYNSHDKRQGKELFIKFRKN